MAEKKKITEQELNDLSEDQLNKVSGGYYAGDTCPKCGMTKLEKVPHYNIVRCPSCGFEEGDSRSI